MAAIAAQKTIRNCHRALSILRSALRRSLAASSSCFIRGWEAFRFVRRALDCKDFVSAPLECPAALDILPRR